MAEPQPSTVAEGDTTTSVPASNSEDRKAAAAMDSLDDREMTAAADTSAKKEVDQKALGDAMKRLDVGGGASKGVVSETKKKADAKRAEEERIAEERRKVKVDAQDVALVVSPFEEYIAGFLLMCCRSNSLISVKSRPLICSRPTAVMLSKP